ncbi:sigma-54 dependent transcriptional regulator, partial [bacterium]|nr:sigma-54 dependent transcriptional regulator [bacterium]
QKHKDADLTINLSPGTPAMAAVWILLGKTKYKASFVQTSREKGVQKADIPFDITAEFLPSMLETADQNLSRLIQSNAPEAPEFKEIITQNPKVLKEIKKAKQLALYPTPVLIQGESGTGKELFARAIHKASLRKDKPFIPVNCGALPVDLTDSMLFGHKKGSFTGATDHHKGFFEEADGGTLFLDEFGELPLTSQVKLLRTLQEGEILPVGENKPRKVDIRLITATNKDLLLEMKNGKFREDLFYRIAIGVISLPPLREREGDLKLLTDHLLKNICTSLGRDKKDKNISIKGNNFIQSHAWPGNIRELQSCLTRAVIWSEGKEISESEIRESILTALEEKDSTLNQDINSSFEIGKLLAKVELHYFEKALKESHGKASKAANLLGIKNYQTFNNRLEKLRENLDGT